MSALTPTTTWSLPIMRRGDVRTCRGCGRGYALRADLTIRRHYRWPGKPGSGYCRGGRQAPAQAAAPLLNEVTP